jgi:hypothetical protein
MKTNLKLKAGESVEVRSKEEILSTLDKNGQLDGLPFMPEMFAFCGKRFRVYKRAHKTCDTITGEYRGRKMQNAVHLDNVRCDGQSHGGCQAGCLIFWKEAWVKRVSNGNEAATSPAEDSARQGARFCTDADVIAATQVSGARTSAPIYACQATRLLSATQPLSSWDPEQYIEDLTSRNIRPPRMINGFIYMACHRLANAGIGVGKILRWLYDASAGFRRGYPYPRRTGAIPVGAATPTVKVEFEPGDWVRVKSYQEILKTLDQVNKNRGLAFDAELVPYCGRTYRILKKVTRIVDEKTGEILTFKTPCYILDGVICQGRYSDCRLFCPRAIYSYWREIWLERVTESGSPQQSKAAQSPAASEVRRNEIGAL